MGNHICRFYIKDYGLDSVHKIAFVAPPFKGALAMITALIKGQGLFKNIKKKLREIVRTFPRAIELLPRYESAAVFNSNDQVDFYNKDHWQHGITTKINSPNEYQRKLAKKVISNLKECAKNVNDLDTWMDGLSDAERKRMIVIVRDEFETDQAIRVDETDGMNTADLRGAVKSDHGDGVVPHASSCCYHDKLLTLAIEDSLRYDDDSHAFFMTEERVQDLVGWFFEEGPFDYHIPGNSIRRVKDMVKVLDETTKLYHHKIVKE